MTDGCVRPGSCFGIVFLLGTVFGMFIARYLPGKETSVSETRPGGYEFINPLLECDMAQDAVEGKELLSLKQKIRDLHRRKEETAGDRPSFRILP